MNYIIKKNYNVIFLFALTFVFLLTFYSKVIFHPNSYIFNSSGDGIKNYYTYAYFIKNNVSNTNFEGMNYPYGENFMYTDCHPFLAFVLKTLTKIFPGLSNYSIGILNFILIVSFVLTVWLLYLIFKELKVNPLLSVTGSLAIAVLSPQIIRLTGHLALSYSFVIPLTIYLLLLFEKRPAKTRPSVYLVLSILLFYFTHAYLGMIAATLVFVYSVVSSINQVIQRKLNYKNRLLLMLCAVFPVGLFYVFVNITDIHSGRTNNPWGILEAYANLGNVFLPGYPPLNKVKDIFFPHATQYWEAMAYIGGATVVGVFFYVWVSFKSAVESKTIALNKTWVDNQTLRLLFVASILVLLFAMFIPFRFHLEHLINHFNIIKQFRAIGRFAWVFYFVSTILFIYILNTAFVKLEEKQMKWPGYIIVVLVPMTLFFEGIFYHIDKSKETVQSPNLFDLKQNTETFQADIKAIDPSKYQAILPLPFYYIGSENYGKNADNEIYLLTDLFSYHLNLPILGSYLTRTSICESKNIMQLFASNFYSKRIQGDLPNKKPLLIICENIPLSENEAYYLKNAKCLVKRDKYSLLEIDVAAFFKNNADEMFAAFEKKKNSLTEKNGFLVSDTSLYFSFTDYTQPNCDISFTGNNGCYSGALKNYNTFFTVKKECLKLNHKYTARFWMYNAGPNCGQDRLGGMIFFEKRKGENVDWLPASVSAGHSFEINNDWSMVEITFENTDKDADYDLVLKGSDIDTQTIYIDELLFYDSELSIYQLNEKKGQKVLFCNNHRIKL